MANDLFGDAVEDGWNRGGLTDTFLSEAEDADVDPQPRPQPQPEQPPRRSFVPEGYEAPSVVQAQYDKLTKRYRLLDGKLAKAKNRTASENPYSVEGQDGQVEFDNLTYNDDMRQLGSLKMEIDNLKDKLRDSRETAQVGQQGVRQYARDFFLRAQEHIAEGLREKTKAKFSYYFQDLVRTKHFENPANLSSDRLDSALGNIFRAAVGDAVLAQKQGGTPKAKSPGTTEDDVETKDDNDDPYADMPEESRKMVEAFERHSNARGGTLADRARQGGNR